jgi:hypothetical protein
VSHFLIAVLTENGTPQEVEKMMAPYKEADGETENPKSFWDWYEIGGRWNGHFGGNNRCKVGDLPPAPEGRRNRFFGLITPDGAYHSKGRGGWFGMVFDEKENWPEIESDLLTEYPDHIAVVVDFHV